MISCNSFAVLRTQVDIEMSFTTKEHIQRLIEGLLTHSWPEDMDKIVTPFPEMKYKDAMRNYGVDKPDTRFDNLVILISFSFFRRNLMIDEPFFIVARHYGTHQGQWNV